MTSCTFQKEPVPTIVINDTLQPQGEFVNTDTSSADTTSITVDSVLISFTWSGSYCNGAPPPEEMLEEIHQPKKLSSFRLLLNNETSFRTNEKGQIKIPRTMGKAEFWLSPDNSQHNAPYDLKCDEYYKNSWGKIYIDSTRSEYKVHMNFPCNLCDPDVKVRP